MSELSAIEANEGPPGPGSSICHHGCPLALLGLLLLLRRPLRRRGRRRWSLLLLWMRLRHPELARLLLGRSPLVLLAEWRWLPVSLNLLSRRLSRGPWLGRAVSCSGLRGQKLLALAVKSYYQILESPVIVGDFGACVDLGHKTGVEICLQQGFHRVPVGDLVILRLSHLGFELLHEHSSRRISLS